MSNSDIERPGIWVTDGVDKFWYPIDRIIEMDKENTRLRAALEAVEFLWFYNDSLSFDGPSGNYCPFCWGVEKHKPKCQRQLALGLQP